MNCRLLTLGAVLLLAPCVRADDRAYADELKAAGHSVKRDKAGEIVSITFTRSENLRDADYERLGQLTHIKQLTFYGTCRMTDANAAHLGQLVTLEGLAINGTALSDAGFKPLGRLKQLRKLTFWHLGWQKVPITGAGFAELAPCSKLESFGFAGSTIGDEGLIALTRVKSLQHLTCYHTRITDAGMVYLKELPHLRSIAVGPQFSMRLGDAGLATLATIPTLESITYNETSLSSAGSLNRLPKLKALKKLKLNETELCGISLEQLKALLPGVAIEHTQPDLKKREQLHKKQRKQ